MKPGIFDVSMQEVFILLFIYFVISYFILSILLLVLYRMLSCILAIAIGTI